jgi:CheY-like chemotaxis protein
MKKIAIIEDRHQRQSHFLEMNEIVLDDYSAFLDNFIEEEALNVLEDILNKNFQRFSSYDIIMCHKSVEYRNANSEILSTLRNYCKDSGKTLILFSGGISVNYYDHSEFEFLELNSKTFYSHNLRLFLDAVIKGNEDILMLCYGEHWKQNIVANTLEKMNLFIFDLQKGYENSENFSVNHDLYKVDYEFYELQMKSLDEIIRFRDSLIGYFEQFSLAGASQKNSALIHCDNVCDPQLFSSPIKFAQSNDEIDVYISQTILKELSSKEFDVLFIKDNLSTNYLELYGLRVAYHVRLSAELGDKRFVPIVIISDFDAYTLNTLDSNASILFTDGFYVCKNTYEDISHYQSLVLDGFKREYYGEFLQQIRVEPPKDTSGSHDIANQWSIYRWADVLHVETDTTIFNKEAIENKLYFKYLRALNTQQTNKSSSVIKLTNKGKVLLIDDEWKKGWADVVGKALKQEGIEFSVFEYDFKDKTNFNLIMQLKYKNLQELIAEADVIVLDLRLIDSDHEHDSIDDYSGIKILEKIHEINAGIQVIMLTATSKSTTLEKLYEKKILGYIKKEHPEDISIYTVENINKLIRLVDKGLERKYLKIIYHIMNNILETLDKDIFSQYGIAIEKYEPFWKKIIVEVESIFDILDSNSKNRFLYSMVSISSSIESILSIYIPNDREMIFWDKEKYDCPHNALRCRIMALFEKLGSYEKFDMQGMIEKRNNYMHKKSVTVDQKEIVNWFKKLQAMIQIIQNPPNLKKYDKNDLIGNLQSKFK